MSNALLRSKNTTDIFGVVAVIGEGKKVVVNFPSVKPH